MMSRFVVLGRKERRADTGGRCSGGGGESCRCSPVDRAGSRLDTLNPWNRATFKLFDLHHPYVD